MGYMRHHAIVVTTYNDALIEEARNVAIGIFCEDGARYVSEIVTSPVNGYRSFFVAPDGSKEGWPESDHGDGCRAAFFQWLRSKSYEDGSNPFNWASVLYGDDDLEVGIEDDGDADRRRAP